MRGGRDNHRDKLAALVRYSAPGSDCQSLAATLSQWLRASVEQLKTEALEKELAHVRRNQSRRGTQTRHGEQMRAKIRSLVTDYRFEHPKRSRARMVTDLRATWPATTKPRTPPSRSAFYTHLTSLGL